MGGNIRPILFDEYGSYTTRVALGKTHNDKDRGNADNDRQARMAGSHLF
jgi:hypothetical protein